MRTLVVTNIASADGRYVTGPDWPLEIMDAAFDRYNAERLRAADTLLLGRTTYEGFRDFWPPVADDPDERWTADHREISRRDNKIEKVVVSDTLGEADTGAWRDTTQIVRRADAHEHLAALKQRPGREILVFGSRTLWNDLLPHGLVDELHVMVGPVLLGSGPPLVDGTNVALRPLGEPLSWPDSRNLLLRYAVG